MSFTIEVINQKGGHISEFWVNGEPRDADVAVIKSEGKGADKVLLTVVVDED